MLHELVGFQAQPHPLKTMLRKRQDVAKRRALELGVHLELNPFWHYILEVSIIDELVPWHLFARGT